MSSKANSNTSGWFRSYNCFFDKYAQIVGIHGAGVYSYLSRLSNQVELARPSISKIADKLNISRTTVVNSIKNLEFWNIIHKIITGRNKVNLYKLIHPKDWKEISEYHLVEYRKFKSVDLAVKHSIPRGETQLYHEVKSKKTINKKTNYKEATIEGIEADEKFEPPSIFKEREIYFLDEEKNQERLRILREAKKKIQTRSVVN